MIMLMISSMDVIVSALNIITTPISNSGIMHEDVLSDDVMLSMDVSMLKLMDFVLLRL